MSKYPEDIARALCEIVGETDESKIGDCVEEMYQFKAIAENEYNADFHRTFYDVLSRLVDVQEKIPKEDLGVAIVVQEGLVQTVYANGNVCVDVYDLDNPDTEDEVKDALHKLVFGSRWYIEY